MQHRMSNVDKTEMVATCAVCGPRTPVRFKAYSNRWVCRVHERELNRTPAAVARRFRAEVRRRDGSRPIDRVALDEFLQATEGQRDTCAICGRSNANGRALALDHCHATGDLRGWLCHPCNAALGLMQDDPERLLRAVQYLAGS